MENTIYYSPRLKRCARLGLPLYTLGEELVNAITHGLGALLSVAALILLLLVSVPARNPVQTFSVLLYGISLITLYLCSTLYHALRPNRAKKVFRIIDHCSIYLLIAGTYTPFSLLVIGGGWGLGIGIAVWTCAILGVTLNAVDIERFKVFSMISYIGMGWCIVIVFSKLTASLSENCIYLLLLGGIFYTLGTVLFGMGKKVRYMHSLWHLFVLAGSIAHFFSIYLHLAS